VLAAGLREATPEESRSLYPDSVVAGTVQAVVGITRVRLADAVPVAIERAAFPET
jgi:GntR family transcriptional regulator